MKRYQSGFTLIELMIVVAIIAFLSMISIPSFMRFLAKAKRAEAYMNLGSLYVAQKAYWAEHGKYTNVLSGADGAGWKPEGYSGGGSGERFYYTYGFNNGQEGQGYFTGKLNAPASDLLQTNADQNSFIAAAAGDIDGDGQTDVLTVNEHNDIKILQDDLA
ncbi:MAG: prepilin-type N-terminal cleavage/methylation domain-containing protein [Candidatus Babeliales bacterium]